MKQDKRPSVIPDELLKSECDLTGKLITALAIGLVASFFLLGCGSASDKDAGPIVTAEVDTELPDFTDMDTFPTAEDSCTTVGLEAEMQCRSGFMAGNDNCGNATFKFVAVVDGYMYVQTMNEVIIRQGEYHVLNFDQKPDVWRVQDQAVDWYQSYYKCLGQEGKL